MYVFIFIYFIYLFIQYFTRVTLLATIAILPRGPLKTYIHMYIQYGKNIQFTLSTQVKHILKS